MTEACATSTCFLEIHRKGAHVMCFRRHSEDELARQESSGFVGMILVSFKCLNRTVLSGKRIVVGFEWF